jgi:hypothetical protein
MELQKTPTTIQVDDYSVPPSVAPGLRALTFAWLYTAKVQGRTIEVTLAAKTNAGDSYVQQVLTILNALLPQTRCPANPIRIALLLTDHRKVLPAVSDVLDPDHVNTGYASRCSDIVVYREEEWRKVFIHECFHFFDFDKGADESIHHLFGVSVKIELRETFCEVWARILNCVFSTDFETCLDRERAWACFQLVKVLHFMGLTYRDVLLGTHLERYQEKTNVFAYYVLSAILLHDTSAFLAWSGSFNAPPGLAALIERLHRTPFFLSAVAAAETSFRRTKGPRAKTLRMSLA